jgi:hypothetical protein
LKGPQENIGKIQRGCELDKLIHNNDGIKMLIFAGQKLTQFFSNGLHGLDFLKNAADENNNFLPITIC